MASSSSAAALHVAVVEPPAAPAAPAKAASSGGCFAAHKVAWAAVIGVVGGLAIAGLVVGLSVGLTKKTQTTVVETVPAWGQFPKEDSVWSYDRKAANQPLNWGSVLNATTGRALYPLCADRENAQQSPINIVTGTAVAGTPSDVQLSRTYSSSAYALLPRAGGHPGFQVVVAPGAVSTAKMMVDGVSYEFAQLHFHSPSEHTVDGKQYPLEAHFVHKDANGNLAVFGILFDFSETESAPGVKEEGAKPNPNLRGWWDQIYYEHKVTFPDAINLQALLDDIEGPLYRYPGSLTTPPCSEGVKWHVTVAKQGISKGQKFTYNYVVEMLENYREVQPLHGRTVTKQGLVDPISVAY